MLNEDKNLKILLINPPLSVHEFPHLALPMLKGYLTQQKIKCNIKDYNVDIMDEIIEEGLEKVERYFSERGMRITYDEVKTRFENARNVFLLKNRQGKEEKAQKLINTYLRIAGSNIFDICFKPDSLEKLKQAYLQCDLKNSTNKILKYIRERILSDVKNSSYKVIGISVPFTSQIFYALVIGREIKRLLPECKVILGGPQISLFWSVLTQYAPFCSSYDGMFYGMGELSLEAYVRAVYSDKDFSSVPNLIYWNEKKELQINSEQTLLEMSKIPMPDFSDLPLDKYIFAKLPYQMSRGCYWSRCVFCSYRDRQGYHTRSVEEVTEHFKLMEQLYGRHIFQFIDDAIRPDILTKFANTLIKKDMHIRYDAYLRLDKGFTPQVCKTLAESGLKNVLFGFESANQRLLNLMKKGNSPENMLQILKNMKQAGIQNILSCLIGFPTETEEEAWESIKFLKDNRQWYYWVYIVHFGLISDMCNDAKQYGVYDIDYNNLIRYDDTGFTALGYPYKTKIGMSVEKAYQVIKAGRQELGIQIFEDNFFS